MGPPESNLTRLDFRAILHLENEFYSLQWFGVPAARMDGFVHVVCERGLVGVPRKDQSMPTDIFCCWKELHHSSSKES